MDKDVSRSPSNTWSWEIYCDLLTLVASSSALLSNCIPVARAPISDGILIVLRGQMLHWEQGGWAASAPSARLPAGSERGEMGAAKVSLNRDGVNAERAAPGGHVCPGMDKDQRAYGAQGRTCQPRDYGTYRWCGDRICPSGLCVHCPKSTMGSLQHPSASISSWCSPCGQASSPGQ